MIDNIVNVTFKYAGHDVTIESNRIARQATAAVTVTMGDTMLLVTLCANAKDDPTKDFTPLTVQYQERSSAYGKIPGGYFRREGRPTEVETLISRLIDRPLRPLLNVTNEMQIIATLISSDPEISPDIPALLGASAVLSMSGIPFNGPVGAARVGHIDGKCQILAKSPSSKDSKLDLVVAGTEKAVLMVESEAAELSEETMLEAIFLGHQEMQQAITAINTLASKFNPEAIVSSDNVLAETVADEIKSLCYETLQKAYKLTDKKERSKELAAVKTEIFAKFDPENDSIVKNEVKSILSKLEKDIVRGSILRGEPRIDGRDLTSVRNIDTLVGYIPRSHGSAVFTRGETQALVSVTLGSGRDAQDLEVGGENIKDNFMLHYNFPPFSVGEIGFVGSPKRREIGHGKLAKRALMTVMPSEEEFPYVVRVISDITESNGSSSMATVCGSSLALMDAGVPLKAPVAGIAMGLIKEDDKYSILTDILGDEDHLGDMDFKVAGTSEGITALQMDIKIEGINQTIMTEALAQAHGARIHILDCMSKAITSGRDDVSKFAPKFITFKINTAKIREVIGRGGATIREITEKFGVVVDIDDTGIIKISSANSTSANEAKEYIDNLIADVEVGGIYEGKIIKIMDFGAFVSLIPGKDGFLHISQISKERVYDIHDVLTEGESVKVKVVEIDKQGRVRVSKKDLEETKAE